MIFLHKNLLTFSGPSLNLRAEKKYIIELIPLKGYNKGLIISWKKKFKRCQNSFLKTSKSIFKILPQFLTWNQGFCAAPFVEHLQNEKNCIIKLQTKKIKWYFRPWFPFVIERVLNSSILNDVLEKKSSL